LGGTFSFLPFGHECDAAKALADVRSRRDADRFRQDICTAVNLLRANYDLPRLSIETVTSYIGDGIDKLVERSLRDTR